MSASTRISQPSLPQGQALFFHSPFAALTLPFTVLFTVLTLPFTVLSPHLTFACPLANRLPTDPPGPWPPVPAAHLHIASARLLSSTIAFSSRLFPSPVSTSVWLSRAPRTAQHGGIAFSHANLRYRPGLPLALRDASFTVRPGDKVGICGRTGVQGLRGRGRETERQRVRETKRWRERLPFLRFCCLSWCKTVPSITVLPSGAGKSTLTSALFRLVELDGGASSFDGVDLAGLGLWTVRRR